MDVFKYKNRPRIIKDKITAYVKKQNNDDVEFPYSIYFVVGNGTATWNFETENERDLIFDKIEGHMNWIDMEA